MVWPQTIVALAPIVAPFLTKVRRNSVLRGIFDRGLMTFVKTIEGQQNTSSSKVTPSYSEILFCILQPFPTVTFGHITTFWPILQFLPILEPFKICEKCQICVPAPISHPLSTYEDSCKKYSCFPDLLNLLFFINGKF